MHGGLWIDAKQTKESASPNSPSVYIYVCVCLLLRTEIFFFRRLLNTQHNDGARVKNS